MPHTLKYRCDSETCGLLMSAMLGSIGYKITAQEFRELLRAASDVKYDCDPHFLNTKLCNQARRKYRCHGVTLVAANHQRVQLAAPWKEMVGSTEMVGLQVSWHGNDYMLHIWSGDAEFPWRVHFGRVLYKIAGNFKSLTRWIELDDRRLRVGEWLAAILFSLSGDEAGMAATIDEALDRQ